ncbi:MAG TPA: hypothetical protein VHZ24_15870 [Pirellulales bacterium]|jgi:hypothetical protein|nr:hypothetical protein [Pirellulales bacterium]
MSIADHSQQAFHRGTAPIFALLSPEQTRQLAEISSDPSMAVRVAELSAKANEGALTEPERAEYEAYIEANNLLCVLQAEARFYLAERDS